MRISKEEIVRRHTAIRRVMAGARVDALVVGCSARSDRCGALRYVLDAYLQFFEEFVVIPLEGAVAYFAHDEGRAKCAEDLPAAEYVDCIDMSKPGRKVAEYIRGIGSKSVGFYGMHSLSAGYYLSLRECMDGIPMIDFTKDLDAVRMVKSDEEIALSERAVRLNEDIFHVYMQCVVEGGGELDAINAASLYAAKNSCEDQYWLSAFGGGVLRSLPSAEREEKIWKKGDSGVVVLEHSAQGGYFGEVMHSFALGTMTREAAEAFRTISQAQRCAGESIKPGTTAGEIADLIDEILLQSGFIKQQHAGKPHGHGQGLDITEPPLLVHGDSTVIRPGMRLNIHPRVTLPSGITLVSTDCYVSTDAGARRLSALSYEPYVIR